MESVKVPGEGMGSCLSHTLKDKKTKLSDLTLQGLMQHQSGFIEFS